MSIRVAREFQGRWEVFWATTYSLELELFEEYLFRRLGDPPLNATVLADFYRLSRLWDAHAGDELRRLQRANRDYLLRGVAPGGAFHPKTYFFGNRTDGALLVGSGNLTLKGIEEGHEVFVRFESGRAQDLASIRGWRDWTDTVVERLNDREVTYRWLDLKQRTPWLEGAANGSMFVSNVVRPLLDQLAEGIPPPVDELHVLAPYFDHDARALASLLTTFAPRRLTLYVGRETSVHGPALLALLERVVADASILEFDPDEFVHAKLIGLVTGNRGRLLSGSANLSQAALLATAGHERWANIEAGVLFDTTAEVVRGAFESSRLALRNASTSRVSELVFEPDEEGPRPPLALRAARVLPDGRVEVDYVGETDVTIFLSSGSEQQELADRRTIAEFPLGERDAFVWLCNQEGAELSNKVPVDDPTRLRGWLEERTSAADRPRELEARDFETPVGRMLLYLHDRCIFDIDETAAAARAGRLANEEAGESEGSWDFLEQLLKDELRFDHRAERYRALSESGLPADDEVLALLRLMLERTPAETRLRLLGAPDEPDGEDGKKPGAPWSPERRLQIRLFNVLERWSRALSDPRYAWIDPLAPLRNYLALVPAVSESWEQAYLPEHRVVRLAGTLFSSFLRSERANGYLLSLDDVERQRALAALPLEARLLASGLLYAALRPTAPWREYLFEWQPSVVAGLELGVFEVAAATPAFVARLVAEEPSATEIEKRLIWAAEYIDDEHWCLKQQRDLDLRRVVLTKESFNPRYGITLAVEGVERGLDDARLVPLVRQALEYRKVDGAIMEVGATRLSVLLGDHAWARIDGQDYQSRYPIDGERLREFEQRGASWASVLLVSGSVAS